MTRVRTFSPGEQWPSGIWTGFESMPRTLIEHNWIFVVETDQVLGMLVTTPAHGLVILMRCAMVKGAPVSALRALLVGSFRILSQRGYHLWVSALDPTSPAERALYALGRKWGAQQWPTPVVVMAGLTSRNKRGSECHS